MSLHLVSTSPWAGDGFEQCRRIVVPGDALLLLGDGVYAAMAGGPFAAALGRLTSEIDVYVLDEDCTARGVRELVSGVEPTDYAGFVALACSHVRSVSWF